MELSAFPSFKAVSNASFFPFSSNQVWCRCSLRLPRRDHGFRWIRKSKPFVRIRMCSEKGSSGNGYGGIESGETKSDFVEVIGIGSRKDAVLDFCLNSPFQLSSLRFWNILMKESQEVQLQQRSIEEEPHPRIVKAPVFMKSCSKTIVLVASAGYGLDHTVAVDIFDTVRSLNGLTVAIVLKPFSFEGLRRQDEVKALAGKLKENTNLLIEIDIDALLKKDLLTLDEAVKTANDAVLLAIKAISVLNSETHRKFIDRMHDGMNEASTLEINKILECYKEAGIGFGAAYNIKTSILQSIFDCPFLGVRLKDPNSVVICILAGSIPINNSNIEAFLHTFRQTTEYARDIIISTVHEPDVEPNLLITTVLALGSNVKQSSQNGGILSRLALHFPLVFSFWGRHVQQQGGPGKENAESPREVMGSYDIDVGANRITPDVIDDNFNKNYVELEPAVSNNSSKFSASRDSEKKDDLFDTVGNYSILYDSITRGGLGDSAFQREQLENWNLGPGFEVAKEWAQERAADTTPMVEDNLSIFHLPVGVRPSEELKDCLEISFMTKQHEPETDNNVKVPALNGGMPPWSAVTDAGLEAVMEFASSLLKGKYANKPKKDGVLSVRAASMLEAERDLSKKWSPVVEMQYRGGRYKGRCQGGLPEGKGRLVLGNGSIYDGLWRYGKRSGPGTFYFKNGDMFQGSWRDDVMHGKGWFYFHTGDRWFANFWKGKANGEGRFYTKSGDAFFGNFKDGWRHGQFLCINANGTRYIEIWEQGVLLDSKHLDS
ncbi:protein ACCUMULATION AND REPLICATION OF CHLOROPLASTS 3, chloroplastic isoform X2 [Gastrolobium bilobum]|uniref:protein ACCUMULATION AND REPLICATION OF CHLOROPLASTS 3, chloroplastic isoform X2 n=1 Tax=Gastrolobium bilobum TaxID=150636 RepID=UPI002AAFD46F|nr:protein ACCUMULATION AND REPLICATION OF CHLOROPLASTS 3, chloroplastic isoform X2 [Gastrolobium bilobum]